MNLERENIGSTNRRPFVNVNALFNSYDGFGEVSGSSFSNAYMEIEHPEDKSIEENFSGYLINLNDNSLAMSSYDRKWLSLRILKEATNFLEHTMFLTLMNHEKNFLLNGGQTKKPLMVLTLTIVVMAQKKGSKLPIEDVETLFAAEFNLGDERTSFYTEAVGWLIDLLMNRDSQHKEAVLHYMQGGEHLEGIEDVYGIGPAGLSELNERLDTALSTPHRHQNLQGYRSRMIRKAITLFLVNLSFGDTVNAKYFLMKAIQMNYGECEVEHLLYFLNDIFLTNLH